MKSLSKLNTMNTAIHSMSIKLLSNTQIELIAMFAVEPKLLEKTVIDGTYLDIQFRKIYDLFLESYKKYGTVNIDEVFMKYPESIDYINISALVTPCVERLRGLERILIERFKEVEIGRIYKEFESGRIEPHEMVTKIQDLSKISADYQEKLTSSDIIDVIKNKSQRLEMTNFMNIRSCARFRETDLIVVAGTPGMGKSAFALNMLENISINYECIYINMEMSKATIYSRLVAIKNDVNVDFISGYYARNDIEKKQINKMLEFVNEREIKLVNGSMTIEDLRAMLSNDTKTHKVVFVDHVGLINCRNSRLSTYERTTLILKELRSLCLDCNCTIFALSQFNRQAQKKKPTNSMLRDSGEIEQSASKIILLYEENEEYFAEVTKNRDGGLGRIKVKFIKEKQIFKEL